MHATHSFVALAVLASFSSATIAARQDADVVSDFNGYVYTSCQTTADFNHISYNFSVKEDAEDMTVDECTNVCSGDSGHDFTYAAVSGSQCMCGVNFGSGIIAPSSSDGLCNTPCPGDDTETCGGNGHWSLFSLDEDVETFPSTSAPAVPTTAPSTPATVPTTKPTTPAASVTPATSTTNAAVTTYTTSPTSVTTKTATLSAMSTYGAGFSTMTIYSTKTLTITSCAVAVTNCPATTSTTLIPISTTVVPIGATTSKAAPYSSSNVTITALPTTVSSFTLGSSTSKATSSVKSTPTPTTFKSAATSLGVESFGLILSLVGLFALI